MCIFFESLFSREEKTESPILAKRKSNFSNGWKKTGAGGIITIEIAIEIAIATGGRNYDFFAIKIQLKGETL